jgi:(5-formylfuran-3-yl)methyl phosphate synthase
VTFRPGLLVSVRNAAEALAALEGGADVIDIKEPSRGPLGRADDQTIAEILDLVGKRRPVSAALGDWTEPPLSLPEGELAFCKWGLAGWAGRDWQPGLARVMTPPCQNPRPVLVAYADWELAHSPPVHEVAETACQWGSGLLLDTFDKTSGRSLLDWLPHSEIVAFCRQCREKQVPIVLAGSLGPNQIISLAEARPNWFGVRGAVCDGGRQGRICPEKVKKLADLVH